MGVLEIATVQVSTCYEWRNAYVHPEALTASFLWHPSARPPRTPPPCLFLIFPKASSVSADYVITSSGTIAASSASSTFPLRSNTQRSCGPATAMNCGSGQNSRSMTNRCTCCRKTRARRAHINTTEVLPQRNNNSASLGLHDRTKSTATYGSCRGMRDAIKFPPSRGVDAHRHKCAPP